MMNHNDWLSDVMFERYMSNLINRFYKILPIRENEPGTLRDYVSSLQLEMQGCKELIVALNNDDRYLSLLSILQYMKCHDMDVRDVRREVFRAINIVKKLQEKYCTEREVLS